ncbi:MAG: lipoyl(octanoyl) transferase LipB [Bdellovibrionales bacterium]|nr:lipoyl(octanoyl) transferase LipB [Bdellovibrionales bacterium]
MIKIRWGEVGYLEGCDLQLVELQSVAEGEEDRVVFCTHPPVVTKGRGTKDFDIVGWQGDIVETSRGGRATYHGPSQIVIYPIVHLNRETRSHKRDLHRYLRGLEEGLVDVLRSYDVDATTYSDKKKDAFGEELLMTGVWVGDRKIASLGVAVKQWVTYHGAALNFTYDPAAFQGMNPCGFPTKTMISLEEIIGKECLPTREVFEDQLFLALSKTLV